jgi:DNA-nicking Smr family endonuclease
MDDEDLFREAMQDVKPLSAAKPVVDNRLLDKPLDKNSRAKPTEAQLRARLAAMGIKKAEAPDYMTLGEVPPVEPRDFLAWRREGVQELVADRLRKGSYVPKDSLDLHGERVKKSRDMVHEFLVECHTKGHRCVRIVHGRGEKGEVKARLKSYVNAWLTGHPLVNAFVSATREHGGTGAVFVLLKKSKEARDLTREQHGGKAEE